MIELIVLDVDGCLSDGKISYTSSGEEIKSFNVKDGLGIASWKKLGKKVAIITGRESRIVQKRAEELKIDYIFQGVENKKDVLEGILKEENIKWKNVAVIGDDLNDLRIMNKAKLSFTPKNGADIMKKNAHVVLSSNGGEGAVREMIEYIVRKQKLSGEFLKLWL